MIDTNVELRSQDYKRLLLKDIMGQRGLIAVGVAREGRTWFSDAVSVFRYLRKP
jgi:hypothetical protein